MHDHLKPEYSFKDIKRYFSGEMSAAEMHAMELAALNDPFLSDAMEGYENADLSDASNTLEEVNSEIGQPAADERVIKIGSNYKWWRIAAIFIITAGLAIVINYMAGTRKETSGGEIAMVQEKSGEKSIKGKDSVVTLTRPKLDTSHRIFSKTLPAEENRLLAEKKPVPEPVPQATQPDISDSGSVNSASKNEEIPEDGIPMALSAKRIRTDGKEGDNFNIQVSGMITDKMGKPVSNALIISDGIAAVYTNKKGNFSFRSPEKNVKVSITAIDFKTEDTTLKGDNFNVIRLKPNEIRPGSPTVSKLRSGNVMVMEDAENTAVPAGGWDLFQAYVREQVSLSGESVHENVSIRFSINDNGRPYDFSIAAPASPAAADLVEFILRNGPSWNALGQEKTGSLVLKF